MCNRRLLTVGLFSLLGFAVEARGAVDADIATRRGLVTECYMVVLKTHGPRIAARFDVVDGAEGEYLTRVLAFGEDQAPLECLSPEKSAKFLQLFRSFDWNAWPRTKAPELLWTCGYGSTPRIAFRALVDAAYREIEADGLLIPALADLIEVLVPSSQPPSPAPPGEEG